MSIDIANLRRDYRTRRLDHSALDPDPFQQFEHWFAEAMETQVLDPNAMSIASVAADGQPSLRTVLLKYYDASGFVFYTNLESRKSREIIANPRVALLFYWAELSRQVRYRHGQPYLGGREPALPDPPPRQPDRCLGVSTKQRDLQSQPDRKQVHGDTPKFAAGEVPLPSFWGGYRVQPEAIEFWQAGEHRLHDRFLYSRSTGGWSIAQLAP